jgi:UTP--glucose-1-phosphate uridylyltransferase
MKFDDLKEAYRSGRLNKDSNIVAAERIKEFPEDEITDMMDFAPELEARGKELLSSGRWARLILNGGMATRFGGKVKGVCEVYDGFSFLELKLDHMSRVEKKLGLPEIPVAVMNSPATHEVTCKFLKNHNNFGRKKLSTFVQVDAPRLTVDAELFQAEAGKDRAPRGHGDYLWALEESGTFDDWLQAGVTHFDFSNVDNLGATVEPSLVAALVDSGKAMSVEVVRKNPGDAGGAPCLRDGVKGVLEGFYFDKSFDQDRLPFFSPNNLMFEIAALKKLLKIPGFTLPWNVVTKEVAGVEIRQFERIAIDTVYAFNKSAEDDKVEFYRVPREGPKGRFYPIKSPEDLELNREKLKDRMKI